MTFHEETVSDTFQLLSVCGIFTGLLRLWGLGHVYIMPLLLTQHYTILGSVGNFCVLGPFLDAVHSQSTRSTVEIMTPILQAQKLILLVGTQALK